MCLDQMGPESAKSFAGQQLVRAQPDGQGHAAARRAKQEIDYGRRGKGYVFGAFRPATGEAFTVPYAGRTAANLLERSQASFRLGQASPSPTSSPTRRRVVSRGGIDLPDEPLGTATTVYSWRRPWG